MNAYISAAVDQAEVGVGRGQVLVAVGSPSVAAVLGELLGAAGYEVTIAHERQLALRLAVWQLPEVIVLDPQLPNGGGLALCASLKGDGRTHEIAIVMLAGEGSADEELRCISAGADDYRRADDTQALVARVTALLEARRRRSHAERPESVADALARAVALHDGETAAHLQRMTTYALRLGERLGMSAAELPALRFGALLHDIGKVGVEPGILKKPGPLSHTERAHVQHHPALGEQIVAPLRLGEQIGPIVRHHHERWDGRGYPDGLAGERIPLGARIVAVLDAFDAMTNDRPYARACPRAVAMSCLRIGAGSQWDPAVVAAFLAILEEDGEPMPPPARRPALRNTAPHPSLVAAPSARLSGWRRAIVAV